MNATTINGFAGVTLIGDPGIIPRSNVGERSRHAAQQASKLAS